MTFAQRLSEILEWWGLKRPPKSEPYYCLTIRLLYPRKREKAGDLIESDHPASRPSSPSS